MNETNIAVEPRKIFGLSDIAKTLSAVKEAEMTKRLARNKARRDRDQAMRDIGLVKVRGNLGGTYWE